MIVTEKNENKEKIASLAKLAAATLDDKFGEDIVVLDVGNISAIADYFIIATGKSSNQLKAMADEVEKKLFTAGLVLKHSEGYSSSGWLLLDFGDIIIHLFDKESRSFYNLERMWSDAIVVK